MLKSPPAEVRAALRLLKNTDPQFNVVLNWLRQEREDAVKTLSVSRDQWTAAQYQGGVQTLDAIDEAVRLSLR